MMQKLSTTTTLVLALVLALVLPAAAQEGGQYEGGADPEEPVCTQLEGCGEGPQYEDPQYGADADEPACTQLEGCAEEGQYVAPVAASPAPEPTADDAAAVEDQEAPPKPPDSEAMAPPALRAPDATGAAAADHESQAGSVGGDAGEASTAPAAAPTGRGGETVGMAVLPATGGISLLLTAGAVALLLGGLLARRVLR